MKHSTLWNLLVAQRKLREKRKLNSAGKSETTLLCCAPAINLNLFFQYLPGPTNTDIPWNYPGLEPMPFDPSPTEHFSVLFVTFSFPSLLSSRTVQCATRNSLCAWAVTSRHDPKLTLRFQVCCLCFSLATWLRPSSLHARGKIQVKL